jgi:hypothetical protein
MPCCHAGDARGKSNSQDERDTGEESDVQVNRNIRAARARLFLVHQRTLALPDVMPWLLEMHRTRVAGEPRRARTDKNIV